MATDRIAVLSARATEDGFTRYAWCVLGWNVLVVLWGAVVRATGSGAGCGSHWPLCNGEVVPRAPAVETAIELTHRLTSGLALLSVFFLCWWAFRLFARGHRVRRFAVISVIFILVEALLGAGLVLLEYVASNASIGRAIYLSAHLVNTQILLGLLALTAWYARPGAPGPIRWSAIAGALPVMLIVGISGAIAALGDTLFPATSLSEGIRQEMSSTAHMLLRLRVLHPAFAILSAVYIAFAALPVIRNKVPGAARPLAAWCWGLAFLQLGVGAANVLLLAPVWMQVVHLFVANVLWILVVLLTAEVSRRGAWELSPVSGI
jgi:heme A synthase